MYIFLFGSKVENYLSFRSLQMLIDFRKNMRTINLFAILRVKRAGYSIAGKYIHIGPSIPYLLNQIGGRMRNRMNLKATSMRFAPCGICLAR